MWVTLLSGKVVDIPASLYLSLSDKELELELQELTAMDLGEDMDIWDQSALYSTGKKEDPEKDESLPDLTDIDTKTKLSDLDLELPD